jgi:uncharacterized protein (DUF1697 family)
VPHRQRLFVFIRAINVGSRRLTNEQLIEPFIQLGFKDVAAFQAAGNISLRTEDPDAAQPERLEPALARWYGFDPVAFVRTLDEMRAIVETRPFTEEDLSATAGRVQVSFLRHTPTESLIGDALALVPIEDRVAFSGKEWFWLPKNGVGDSRLPVGSIEGVLGPMTIRTLGTISRMLDKFGR